MVFKFNEMLKKIKKYSSARKTFCQFGKRCDFCTPFRKKKEPVNGDMSEP